MLNSKFLLY